MSFEKYTVLAQQKGLVPPFERNPMYIGLYLSKEGEITPQMVEALSSMPDIWLTNFIDWVEPEETGWELLRKYLPERVDTIREKYNEKWSDFFSHREESQISRR